MFTTILAGLRRFFGFSAAEPETVLDRDAPPPDWWIPKDREALAAAQLAKEREAANDGEPEADSSEIAPPETNAAPEDAPPLRSSAESDWIELDLEQFVTMDDVEALLAERRRAKDEEQRRIESIEIPQAMMMNDQEYAVAQDWMLDHRTIHPLPQAEIYGQYWIRFGRSSIGDTATIGCSTCGRTKVLTELSVLTQPFVRREEPPGPKHV
jgi:hypothetical protein